MLLWASMMVLKLVDIYLLLKLSKFLNMGVLKYTVMADIGPSENLITEKLLTGGKSCTNFWQVFFSLEVNS